MNAKLIDLAARFPLLIGCIHGHGLYQGVELVDGRRSHEDTQDTHIADEVLPPGKEIAYAVCDRLLDLGVSAYIIYYNYSNFIIVRIWLENGFFKFHS